MTLFKQILIIMSFFQVLILGVVMWQNFTTANEFIKVQLYTDAKHTANSLGLAIKSVSDKDDLSTIETMINSIFDSGYYEMIKLVDTEDKELLKSYQPTIIKGVPEWFVSLVPLSVPIAKSEIMMGWIPFGTLFVQNNSGIAYVQLWQIFKEVSFSFLIISIIAFIALYLSLNFLLKPLEKVREQADAILVNNFIHQKNIPFTIELKKMVLAMNSMVGKVKEIFETEALTLEKNFDLMYKDAQTSLFNRKYFLIELSKYIESEDNAKGFVIFISFDGFAKLKEKIGYEKTQNLMQNLGKIFAKITFSNKLNIVARTNESDFALLLPLSQEDKIRQICQSLIVDFKQIIEEFELSEDEYYLNFGVSSYNSNTNLKEVLSGADFALSKAKFNGKFNIEFNSEKEEKALGKEAWRVKLQEAMEHDNFKFAAQKVQAKSPFEHYELFLRMQESDGSIQNAGYFMPMSNELKLNTQLDKFVITKFTQMLKENKFPNIPLSINLGKEILTDSKAFSWLELAIKEIREATSQKIYFEVQYFSYISTDILSRFSKILRNYDFGLGIDNFIIDGDGVKRLQKITPAYLKIRHNHILDLYEDKSSESSKQSLSIIIKSLEIELIASGVETKEQKDKLLLNGIEFMQGKAIEEPWIVEH